jgi:hypothetical protein
VALLARVPNPYFGQSPGSSSLGAPTITAQQLLRPFPRFTTVALFRDNIGNSSYNALQAKLEKRFSRGLTFTFDVDPYGRFVRGLDFRMSKTLKILITGAARGIGMATAQVLANRGHSVVATDISALSGLQGIQAHVLDVTSDDSVAQCLKEVGPLDAIVNNAAIFVGGGPVEG